jgi:Tfp pilus assembly ATPase PilU
MNLRAIFSQRLLPRADGMGRIPAVEVMVVTPRIRDLIRRGKLIRLKPLLKEVMQKVCRPLTSISMNFIKQDLLLWKMHL